MTHPTQDQREKALEELRYLLSICYEDNDNVYEIAEARKVIEAALTAPPVPQEVIEHEFIEVCQRGFIFSNVKSIIKLIKREYPDGIKFKGEA